MAMFDDLVDAFEENEVLGGKDIDEEKVEPRKPIFEGSKSLLEKIDKGPMFADLPKSGLRMKFDLRGNPAHPGIVYIPGATSDLRKEYVRLHMGALSMNFFVIGMDLRNQGETTPMTLDRYVPLETYVADIVELLDRVEFPGPVHVVGFGFGAALALLFARQYPSRLNKLVIVSGGAWEKSDAPSVVVGSPSLFGQDWDCIQAMCSYDSKDVDDRCGEMIQYADIRRKDLKFRQKMNPTYMRRKESYVENEKRFVMERATELGKGAMAQMTALYAEGTQGVTEIETDTLILHTRNDGIHRLERAQQLDEMMQNPQLVELPNEDHVSVLSTGMGDILLFLAPPSVFNDGMERAVSEEPEQSLTKAQFMSLMNDLIARYETAQFQEDLAKLRTTLDTNGEAMQPRRIKLCKSIHEAIAKKYGIRDGSLLFDLGKLALTCGLTDADVEDKDLQMCLVKISKLLHMPTGGGYAERSRKRSF